MAVTEPYTFNATVSTTELSIVSGTSTLQNITTAGAYQLYVDTSTMAKADEFRIRIYEKVRSADTKRVVQSWSLLGAQGENFVTPTLMLLNGWDFTIVRTAGADRTVTASVRTIA